MTVLIVDYGMGNLSSVSRAIAECGASALVSDDPASLDAASWIILPGVGAFADGIRNLQARGWDRAIRKAVRDDGIPLLGICLGMQLLASRGLEGGDTPGLDLISGEVRLLEPKGGLRVPHVGWNDVHVVGESAIFRGLNSGTDFYFVHSYQFVPADRNHIAGIADYGGDIVAAVAAERIWGVQFHPEKSSRAGFHLLQNFLSI
ncbi:MAG TPA: imidazole glycerol phosphate synthase subunit HisH [Noviherbaspirillum sp.]|nr:imidazole glycerol phosphate synthase subunit HisH [Noviherbaspirillum sp.]